MIKYIHKYSSSATMLQMNSRCGMTGLGDNSDYKGTPLCIFPCHFDEFQSAPAAAAHNVTME